jgi:hypothetical protein
MKTRKLLLLAAGFMLFALTAQAQLKSTYSYTLKNNNSHGITIQYQVMGQAAISAPSNYTNFIYPSSPGTLSPGASTSAGTTYYGLGEAYIQISAMGHYFTVSRSYLEANGGYLYTGYSGYWVALFCTKSGNHWDLRLEIYQV